MAKFQIRYALGGGFGGTQFKDWETIDAKDLAEAEEEACNEYRSYEGMHGLFNREEELVENPDLTEADLDAMERDDIESWIEFEAQPYRKCDEPEA